jgi:hypothetical protein
MTDIRDELARLLENEPTVPDPTGRIVTRGRRALRRRTALTAVAGTAGTAAVTAAVAVPVILSEHTAAPHATISVGQQPTAPDCQLFYGYRVRGHQTHKQTLAGALSEWRRMGHRGEAYTVREKKLSHGTEEIRICGGPQPGPINNPVPSPHGPSGPRYHYSQHPSEIAARLGDHLAQRVSDDGLHTVFTRPFAQETSTLDKSRPTYYDGSVDVTLPGRNEGNIGVQVTHQVTTQVPFDGPCSAPQCVQTTLGDGSVLRTDVVDPGGGGRILTAEVHRPNGVVVEAQESNYGFGPDAPLHTYGAQPLSMGQLASLAEDPAFTF